MLTFIAPKETCKTLMLPKQTCINLMPLKTTRTNKTKNPKKVKI